MSAAPTSLSLASDFAANLLDAVARRLGVEPDVLLRMLRTPGPPKGSEGQQLREAFADLAFACFPLRHSPSRALSRLCRGETQPPPPMCETLAALSRELDVPVPSLFESRGGK